MTYKSLFSMLGSIMLVAPIQAQKLCLTLDNTINAAADSSLSAIKARQSYLSGYWEYQAFKADRLPSLTLNLTPVQYNRRIVERYDSDSDRDVFRTQQSFFASGSLSVRQNVDWLGGTIYLDTDLDYLRYFGVDTYTQFTSIPVRIGYSQNLIGYNPFKWDKLIEPLKFEKKKRELIYNMEQVSEEAITYFFALAQAQAEHDLAVKNLVSCDTLCRIGRERHKIATISKADLLTLELDVVNARNTLRNAESTLKWSMFQLASFLGMDKESQLTLTLPERPAFLRISADEALQHAQANNPEFLTLKQQILECRQSVDRTRRESGISFSLNVSVGFNQVGDDFVDVYRNLLQQDMVSLTLSIPLVDWGVRKGRYNMARNNLSVVETSARQSEQRIEEEVVMTVTDFNVQSDIIRSAEEASQLAASAYEETRMRFLIGKSDINSLSLSLNRKNTAQKNYITALRNYWLSYYKIRRLTLFDFMKKECINSIRAKTKEIN